MIFFYFIALAIGLFAVGIAGVVASRHFIVMMLGIEIAFSAAIVLAGASFAYAAPGNIVGLLFTVWAVASAEIMGMVAVYRYMVAHGISMDVRLLSKLRDW
jgi:NADH:ubiquinone oxidoreductase subunit K